MEGKCGHAGQLAALEQRCRNQASQIRQMQEALERKNRELDALHYVWCDGGCPRGVHRWTDQKVTREIVETAERNTRRLRRWYRTVLFRLMITHPGEWLRNYSLRAAAKTDLLPESRTMTPAQ